MNNAPILVVEDDLVLQQALCDTLEIAGFDITKASDGISALSLLNNNDYAMVVSDVQMDKMDGHNLLRQIKRDKPHVPVLLMTAYGSIQKAVQAMQDGAVDYLVKPFEAEVLINRVNQFVAFQPYIAENIIAEDIKSKELFKMALRVAQSDANVMINGQSGVGKEVLARYIHENSGRKEHIFVAINCAAIPENMLEATLFGYEKGAFTGAYKSCPGKFEQAQKGTLLLDEISEMDINLQAKLLRVLQEKEVERIGGNKLIDLDVRIVATTNRNLKNQVQNGCFREDLFYRLNVFPLTVGPLCERRDDIIPLTQRFLANSATKGSKESYIISPQAQAVLLAHSWPGNVRELENVMQRAVILADGNQIEVEHLHIEAIDTMGTTVIGDNPLTEQNGNLHGNVKLHETQAIINQLTLSNGSRKDTAVRLGISERTLRYKLAQMRQSGIDIPKRQSGKV